VLRWCDIAVSETSHPELSYHAHEIPHSSFTCLCFHRSHRLTGSCSLSRASGFSFGSHAKNCRHFQDQCQNIFAGDLDRGEKEPGLESGQGQGTLEALGHHNEKALGEGQATQFPLPKLIERQLTEGTAHFREQAETWLADVLGEEAAALMVERPCG